jgi:hypothetical protein
LAEINGLTARIAKMLLIEFIREDLFLLTAFGAGANERFQVLMAFKAWTVLWCGHSLLLWARTGSAAAGRRSLSGHSTGIGRMGLFNPGVLAAARAIRRIAAVIQEFAFFFT